MEREELLTRINEQLGSTKLSLSERTVNGVLDDALSGVTDDAQVTDEFVSKKASFLKLLDGQVHSDVSKEVEAYKSNFKKPVSDEQDDANTDKQSDLMEKFTQLQSKFEEMVNSQNAEKEEARRQAKAAQAKESLVDKLSKSDISVNAYIMRQTMRDFSFSDTDDASTIVKSLEVEYFKNMKEAGFDYDAPAGVDATIVNKKGETTKSRREELMKEFQSRGYLPKSK